MRFRQRAFTLVELMVVVAIVLLVLAVLLPALAAVRDRARINTAKTQMQMIAMAIDEHARFWPPWRTGQSKDRTVTDLPICSRGLPPWRTFELWGLGTVDDALALGNEANRLVANELLTYRLIKAIGSGPYLKKPPGGLVENVTPVRFYEGDTTEQVRRLVDPWGTPYFYCWASDDGMWLVLENFMARHPDWNTNHFVAEELAQHQGHTAVLVSAGPNRQFDFPIPTPGDVTTELGSRIKTWPGDDIVLGH